MDELRDPQAIYNYAVNFDLEAQSIGNLKDISMLLNKACNQSKELDRKPIVAVWKEIKKRDPRGIL